MRTTVLVSAIARKQLILLTRYPLNTASQLVGLYIFFALLFFGGQAIGGPAIGESLSGLIVGFFLFTMSVTAYAGLSWALTREAQWGTLEQLYMSPYGFGRVMAVTVGVNLLVSLAYGGFILASMLLTTGRTLTVDPLTIVPLVVLTLGSAIGVGFVFGGLALVYKRIENIFQLVQFGFILLIAAPVDAYPFLRVFPLAQGGNLLQRAMRDGVHLWEFAPTELFVLVATAVGYTVLGYLFFQRSSDKARRDGVLGHY
ncbi:ABC-2 type transport system permease protein [Halogranum rubrum]|uniref:ABC-2 type transport system permease protein n=1 Tax=Halogranum rubrum TaxID=553466 RepID=A0A1I4EXP9_9EURY|nr:ABC transporter [Halogranum rubrum]SFL09973.1 ABC-2 type transport system permease protein [Halogranum rubrum]